MEMIGNFNTCARRLKDIHIGNVGSDFTGESYVYQDILEKEEFNEITVNDHFKRSLFVKSFS